MTRIKTATLQSGRKNRKATEKYQKTLWLSRKNFKFFSRSRKVPTPPANRFEMTGESQDE